MLDKSQTEYPGGNLKHAQPGLSQFWCFKICLTTLLTYEKFVDLLILRL